MGNEEEQKNGGPWGERVRAAGEVLAILTKPGNLAMAIIIFGGLVWTGTVPSPLIALAGQIEKHDKRMEELLRKQTETNEKTADALKGVERILRDRDRRDKLRECEQIKDLTLRAECLKP